MLSTDGNVIDTSIHPARSSGTGGNWMLLGNADEGKPVADDVPVGGWCGIKKGLRGRFGNYVPPVLEALGPAEVEHHARNNRMRAR